jgi:tripartite-type tricarboxylate transporter receptor subunit TctC
MYRWSWRRVAVLGVVLGLLMGCAPRAATPAATPPAAASPAPSAAAAPGAASPAAGGDEGGVAAFYRGKTVRIIVGLSPGGGYDLTSRLLARHLAARIPGNPTIIVENRPGAGTMLAANAVYATEPKDGTVIGNFDSSLVLLQALGATGIGYDSARFNWLGATVKDVTGCLVRADAVTSLQDTIAGKEVVLGALALGNNSYDVPVVLNATLGTHFKLVPGYGGTAQFRLAVESQETDGYCVTYKSAILVNDQPWLEGDPPRARMLVVMGANPPESPYLRGVPAAESLARTDEARELLRVVDAPQVINKPYAVAPEVPAERVAALRRALMETYADPQFLAEAKRSNLDVDPSSGEEVGRVVQGVLNASPATLARLKEIIK